jgi:protein-disulfide isomerase
VDLVFTDPALDEPQGKTNQQVRDALIQKATEQLGLDANALRECIDSKRYAGKIAQDVEEGQRLGLVSTPSMWVNGRLLESMSPDVMRAVFNSILAERKR